MPTSSNPIDLNAETLYQVLLAGVRPLLRPNSRLVGVWSGGAWLAQRLHRDLGLPGRAGVISSALHRDDFSSRGLSTSGDATDLPFEVEDADLILVDDVLYTGRTVRAAINELFDFGRPSRIVLVALVDRGGRQLPIEAAFTAQRVELAPNQRLSLSQDGQGHFVFDMEGV